MAVLSVRVLPLATHGTHSDAAARGAGADDLVVHSGAGAFGHVHDLLVPKSVLENPPSAGVELTSTKALLHTHTIALTQRDLESVNSGGTIKKKSSSHLFVIALATR